MKILELEDIPKMINDLLYYSSFLVIDENKKLKKYRKKLKEAENKIKKGKENEVIDLDLFEEMELESYNKGDRII